MTPAQTLAREQAKARRESLELALVQQLRALKLTAGLEREFPYHPTRKWRLDWCYPARKLAIECEGGIHTGGRHTRGTGFEADCEKLNEATALGWRVLRVTGDQIKSGAAVQWIERALELQ